MALTIRDARREDLPALEAQKQELGARHSADGEACAALENLLKNHRAVLERAAALKKAQPDGSVRYQRFRCFAFPK